MRVQPPCADRYTDNMHIDPDSLPVADRYKLLIGGIVPRPIALVSTLSPEGRSNLAPFSFFAGVGSNPMTLLFCPANKEDGTEKDTLRNAKPADEGGTGEFVVNVVSDAFIARAVATAEPLAYGESEFDLSGLNPLPSVTVRPCRVAESALAYECRTVQVVRTNPGAPSGGNIVIGRVVGVWVSPIVTDGRWRIDPGRLDAVGRMGGFEYCRTRDRISLPMGKAAIENDRS